MTMIKSMTISGIRGARIPLQLDLDNKSILVYGDNGSGKSSLADAIEWLYSDGIGHLGNEEIASVKGKGALRNIFIPESEDAFIDIHYSNKILDVKKHISNTLKTSISNDSDDYKNYIKATQSENIILRFRDLVKFIIAGKTEKLKTLQEIIGFSAVTDLRDLLKKSTNRIARNIKSENYDNQRNAQQSDILDNLGQNAYTDKQLFEGAAHLIKPLGINKEIRSLKDIQVVLKSIENKDESTLLETISLYTKIGENITEIYGNINKIHSSYKTYYSLFMKLKSNPEHIKNLQILSLLKEGINVLQSDIIKDGYCPLCLQEKSKIKLIKELKTRIDELEDLEIEVKKLEEQKMLLGDILQTNINILDALIKEKRLQEKQNAKYLEGVRKIKETLTIFKNELKVILIDKDPIQKLDEILINKDAINIFVKQIKMKAKSLSENKKSNISLQIYAKLNNATYAYQQYQRIIIKEEILSKQLKTLQTLYNNFIKRQEEALNIFLKGYSANINEYYALMNPSESIENIKLVSLKDKNDDLVGLTIEYSFYHETKTQPIAYLSESHINCLGLSFFLASVKAFNKQNKYFILDDVISSFDRSHRTRFAKLLIEKFSDYQILLLTHEKGFYELIASEVKSKGWLIQDFHWTKENGVENKKNISDMKERIQNKISDKNLDGLGNDIRIYVEKEMKNIAYNLETKVAFRYNELNEKRMAPELMDAVHSQISKKGTELKDKANIQKLKGMPMFIGNITSHDNKFTESLEDILSIWEDINRTINLFICPECNKYISTKYYDNVNSKIRCGCGKLVYDWKNGR